MNHDAIVERLEGPRPPRLEEREPLIAMINQIFRISAGRAPTIASDWGHVYAPQNLANVNIIVDPQKADPQKPDDPTTHSGQVVASTGVWASDVMVGATTLRVGGINCVGTLPEYRRFGLGSKVMAAAHQTMRDLGCHVGLLSTGIPNWYRRMGWEEAGAARSYRLNRGNIGFLPQLRPGLQWRFVAVEDIAEGNIAEDNEEVLAQIVELYHTARLGAMRSVQAFRQLAGARDMHRIAVASWQNAGARGVAAYLLLRDHVIYEWAGTAAEVAGLARAVYEAFDDPNASTSQRASEGGTLLRTITLQTPGWGHPLVNLLDARRIPHSRDYLGMFYLVDPQTVLAAYGANYGVENVRLEMAGGHFVVRVDGDALILDRGQLTKLFFGPERVSEDAGDLFPLPFWQWSLERV